jgi:predicted RNA-binding protein with PIN domain
MTDRRPRDPLEHTSRLVVDGTNLLHALSRSADRLPAATLVGRLRGLIPPAIAIELVFDGPPERGLRGERIASGVHVRYSGSRSADAVILSLVDDVRGSAGPEATGTILVVTDDHDLRNRLRARGARSARADWLLGRLDRGRLASPSAGNPRGPSPQPADGPDDDEDRPRWQPGRGATTKRGPGRRPPGRRRPQS